MSTIKLTGEAILGNELNDADRAKLPPSLLAVLAVAGRARLSPADRRRLSKPTLAMLTVGGFVELTPQERDRLGAPELALLAASGRAELRASELTRLPRYLRMLIDQPAGATNDAK
jgi:hypothetical protein